MKLLIAFTRRYPLQTVGVMTALLLAGLIEGLSLTTLLPLLQLALNSGAHHPSGEALPLSGLGRDIANFLSALGLTPTIGSLLILITLGMALKSLLVLIAQTRVGYIVAQVATDIRLNLLDALMVSRWEYFLRQPVGKLANAIAGEAMRSSSAYLAGVTVLAAAVQCLVYIALALWMSWQATVACLLVGSGLILLFHSLVRSAKRAGKRQTRLLRSLSSRLADSLQTIKPLRAMNRGNAQTMLAHDTRALNDALRSEVYSKELLRAVQDPALAAVVALGMYLALVHWRLDFPTVMTMVVLLGRIMMQLNKIQRQFQRLTVLGSAYNTEQRLILEAQAARERSGGSGQPTLERAILLDDVHFGYSADTPLFRGLTMTFPAGQMTALVGQSGAGKTTVIDLITGLLHPWSGRVRIDDQPLEQLDLGRWRKLIGYVPQENLLLHASVYDNIALGDPDLDEAAVVAALQAAEAWQFVIDLPDGIHQLLGERGGRLSGGQRQRIMIARALVHRPRLLILDEATTALDPSAEAAICRTLERLRGELTIIAISHQPALVEAADRVYRLGLDGAELIRAASPPAGQLAGGA